MSGFLTIEQAAKRVGKTQRTIRNWIDGGLTLRAGYIREDELLERDRLMRSRRGRPRETDLTSVVLSDIAAERARQDAKWGEQNHPDGTGPGTATEAFGITMPYTRFDFWSFPELCEHFREFCQANFAQQRGTWADVLLEEVFEALAEDDPALLRAELVQVAAVAAAWVEAIDRRWN